jgi:hypothetical protein
MEKCRILWLWMVVSVKITVRLQFLKFKNLNVISLIWKMLLCYWKDQQLNVILCLKYNVPICCVVIHPHANVVMATDRSWHDIEIIQLWTHSVLTFQSEIHNMHSPCQVKIARRNYTNIIFQHNIERAC